MELLPRIKELLQWSGLGPAAFADEIGIGRPIMSHIVSSRNKPSLEVVQKILVTFSDVSPYWLLLGQGPMLKDLASHAGKNISENQVKNEEESNFDNFDSVVTQENVQFKSEAKKLENEFKSKQAKELVKVVLLYSDGTFENYNQ